mgnify:CR=1
MTITIYKNQTGFRVYSNTYEVCGIEELNENDIPQLLEMLSENRD